MNSSAVGVCACVRERYFKNFWTRKRNAYIYMYVSNLSKIK